MIRPVVSAPARAEGTRISHSMPSALAEVIGFCELLIAQPHFAVIHPGPQHWSIFVRLCKDVDARGNLVPDAWFAALAV